MGVELLLKAKVKSNLGEILEARGIKQVWVADQIGASTPQVNNWCKNESGYAKSTPNVLYLLRLQELLNVNISEMFEEVK